MGLLKFICTKIKDKKFMRELEANRLPIEVALAKSEIEFNADEYYESDLRSMVGASKKGLDIRYCFLTIISDKSNKKVGVSTILEVLEFEREERLAAGAILNNFFNGYYISVPSCYVQNIKTERAKNKSGKEIQAYIRGLK